MNTWNALRPARASLHGLTLLCLLALVASCDTGLGPEVTPLLRVDGHMGAQLQNLTITSEGAAVTGATVTINGVAIPHTGAGNYQGELPAAVPAGSPLNLQVSADGSTVQGTVNVPEAPVLTYPATGSDTATAGSIHVGWTSATNPDRFVVSATWDSRIFVGAHIEKTFPALGSARELEITSIEPPFEAGTDITISVVAYNHGSFIGQVDPNSRMSVGIESSPKAVIVTKPAPLLIVGDMAAQLQNLTITRGGVAVSDATVTINGVAVPHTGAGDYQGELPAAVPAGSTLNLQVSAGEATVQGTVKVPETPVLTDPATGSDTATAGAIHVGWTSATNPDRFVVTATWASRIFVGAHIEKTFPAPGSARELEITSTQPPFEPGTEITIRVFAYNDGSFIGQVDPDSRLSVGIESIPDAGSTSESVPLLIVGDMAAQLQNLTITREGVAVSDATVTINGVAIPHTGAGNYQGELPAAVPAGSPLNLQVRAGEATVQGTVNVPEEPVLTAPAAGAAFDPRDTIMVSWTSAANPDRFVVSGAFINSLNGVHFDLTLPAAGTARELEIPLPPEFGAAPGTTFSVFAYNDVSFTGQVDPDSRMSVSSETFRDTGITTESGPLLIVGGVGARSQNIWIFQGGRDLTDGVTGAVVTVNGVTIPGTAFPYYHGELPAAVPAGSPLHLRVSVRGLIVEATGNVPEAPVVTAPAEGAVLAPDGSITVRWTSATDPDRFAVYVNTNGPVGHRELPGTARELEIATSELPGSVPFAISVVAYNDGSFSGPAHADSRMGIMSVGDGPVITINR